MTLKEAIKVLLVDESIEDFVYTVRDRAQEELRAAARRGAYVVMGDSWELVRVKRFSAAIKALKEALQDAPEVERD